MARLEIGKTVRTTIKADEPWNDSQIDLVKNGQCDFLVPGVQTWKDASIPADADGYPTPIHLKIFEPVRRIPKENFFKLIGTIGRSLANPVIIGRTLSSFSAPIDGRLYCFANDVRDMYWNNCGLIELNVTRRA
jgi:hypothetical protein